MDGHLTTKSMQMSIRVGLQKLYGISKMLEAIEFRRQKLKLCLKQKRLLKLLNLKNC